MEVLIRKSLINGPCSIAMITGGCIISQDRSVDRSRETVVNGNFKILEYGGTVPYKSPYSIGIFPYIGLT